MSVYTFLLISFLWINAETKSYDGYKLYEIVSSENNIIDSLINVKDKLQLDFWDDKTVLVSPENNEQFITDVKYIKGIQALKLLNNNIGRSVYLENLYRSSVKVPEAGQIDFKNYYRYTTIVDYLKRVAKQYSKNTTLINIGKSYEGRDLYALKIFSGGSNTKPVIFIDAGIHAREWIAPSTGLYIIQQIIENNSNAKLYEKFDWYIIPLINPDGYEYSHTTDRFWRKTRSPNKICYGTDANRNFGFKWGLVGSSDDECSLTYRGREPFSESETRAVRDIALKYEKSIKLYLTLHSYGQLLLHPWGYTKDAVADVDALVEVGKTAAEAIKSINGTIYRVGSSAATLGLMSGSSRDWFAGETKIKYSYTVELPGGGEQGFDLPPSRIEGVVKETFEGIKSFWQQMNNIY